MGTSTREVTSGLATQKSELVKQYFTYDGIQRVTSIFTAPIAAKDGAPCTRVDYEYLNATSSNITKMRESNDVWSSAYDI